MRAWVTEKDYPHYFHITCPHCGSVTILSESHLVTWEQPQFVYGARVASEYQCFSCKKSMRVPKRHVRRAGRLAQHCAEQELARRKDSYKKESVEDENA